MTADSKVDLSVNNQRANSQSTLRIGQYATMCPQHRREAAVLCEKCSLSAAGKYTASPISLFVLLQTDAARQRPLEDGPQLFIWLHTYHSGKSSRAWSIC